MRNITFIFILGLLPMVLHAAGECRSKYWTLEGNIAKDALEYDAFLKNLPANPVPALNEYIRKHGLLLQLNSPSGTVHGHEDYLLSEGASGTNVGLFSKFMRVTVSSNISFDTVYEIEKPDAKKAVRKWNVPYGARPPAGVDAFGIIYPELLTGICSDFKRSVNLAVSEEGIYRAVDREKFPEPEIIPEKKCDAQRTFFKDSQTAACGEFKDLLSGKPRILVWDARIK